MKGRDVLAVHDLLSHESIDCWIVGGWGVDALLGRESRRHKDLDILIRAVDVDALFRLLEARGYSLKELWSESLWLSVGKAESAVQRPTAFVLADADGRELDVHVIDFDGTGQPVALWTTERAFTDDALAGEGFIDGRPVACMSIAMQLVAHADYELPESHREDLQLLRQLRAGEAPE